MQSLMFSMKGKFIHSVVFLLKLFNFLAASQNTQTSPSSLFSLFFYKITHFPIFLKSKSVFKRLFAATPSKAHLWHIIKDKNMLFTLHPSSCHAVIFPIQESNGAGVKHHKTCCFFLDRLGNSFVHVQSSLYILCIFCIFSLHILCIFCIFCIFCQFYYWSPCYVKNASGTRIIMRWTKTSVNSPLS